MNPPALEVRLAANEVFHQHQALHSVQASEDEPPTLDQILMTSAVQKDIAF